MLTLPSRAGAGHGRIGAVNQTPASAGGGPAASPAAPRSGSRAGSRSGEEAGRLAPYDAVLLQSFGGPERPEDVMPFLQNVTRGRGVPPERLASVAEHYYAVGGVSPINQQCRDLL